MEITFYFLGTEIITIKVDWKLIISLTLAMILLSLNI